MKLTGPQCGAEPGPAGPGPFCSRVHMRRHAEQDPKAFLAHLWLSVAVATVARGGRDGRGGFRDLAGSNLGNTNKPRREM